MLAMKQSTMNWSQNHSQHNLLNCIWYGKSENIFFKVIISNTVAYSNDKISMIDQDTYMQNIVVDNLCWTFHKMVEVCGIQLKAFQRAWIYIPLLVRLCGFYKHHLSRHAVLLSSLDLQFEAMQIRNLQWRTNYWRCRFQIFRSYSSHIIETCKPVHISWKLIELQFVWLHIWNCSACHSRQTPIPRFGD